MVQYKMVVEWDASLMDVGFTDTLGPNPVKGLAIEAIKITTGAPAAIAGFWCPGAQVYNVIDGTWYQMTGSTASPAWTLNGTGAFSLPASITDSSTTTGTSLALILSALTSGVGEKITAVATTSGKIFQAIAAAATLTTGRYFSANDGSLDVWGIGANGHVHSNQTTAPTIGTVTAHGITAAAVTAGSTDVCGQITTTGTQDNTTDSVIPIVFNKTYTTAPKSIQLTPLNSSGAVGSSQPYISAISATGFSISVSKSASAAATPSWAYQVNA